MTSQLYPMLLIVVALAVPIGSAQQNQAASRKRILVLCTGNSARSQMGAGVLKSLDAGLDVHSAGTQPAARVNPLAIRAMKEIGIADRQEVGRHLNNRAENSHQPSHRPKHSRQGNG